MFRRRLGNYVIKRIWELQNRPADLPTFTRNRRNQPEDLEQVKEAVAMQPLTFQMSEEPQDLGVVERTNRVLNPDELMQISHELVLKDPSPPRLPPKSWISPLLSTHQTTLQESFATLDYRGDQALGKEGIKDMFRETIGICELELSPQTVQTFSELVDSRCSARSKISFPAFLDMVEEWAILNPVKAVDFATQLRRTIQEYEDMIGSLGGPNASTQSIELLVNTLRTQLRGYLSKKEGQKQGKSVEEIQAGRLSEVFSFYAKQQRLIGTAPTFDEITTNNSQWTVGKFFKFCSDHDLMGRQTSTARRLTKDEIMNIFKKCAALTRNMELKHFIEALDEIAEMFFDAKYDEIARGNSKDPEGYLPVCDMSLEDKRKKLYTRLKLLDTVGDAAKTGRSVQAPKLRPPEDAAVRRPRFRLPKQMQQPRKEEKPVLEKQSKSVDPRPMKAKQIEAAALPLKPAQPSYSHRYVQKNVSAEPLSWQSLNKMHPGELASEDDIRNVIGDGDEDDELEQSPGENRISRDLKEKAKRLGPQTIAQEETRLDRVMRQHDRKVETGLKVLNRSGTKAT
jgi:Ca2+-binding EF-hand superfamily protein